MYSMKETCERTGMQYETLKYYCKEGLIPNVKRDAHNYRIFDETDISWIKSLLCLKKCGMGLKEMKAYTTLCEQGIDSIEERKAMLAHKKTELLNKMQEIHNCIAFIDAKEAYYDNYTVQKEVHMQEVERHKEILCQFSYKK